MTVLFLIAWYAAIVSTVLLAVVIVAALWYCTEPARLRRRYRRQAETL